MHALIVYGSMFGDTAAVAEAIADDLRPRYEVELCPVTDAVNRPAPTDLHVTAMTERPRTSR